MATSVNPKTYTYHIYKNGAFRGILNNVISDFGYQQEINSTGSSIEIILASPADNYSETSLIDFNNDIQIYEIDDTNPNGSLIFRGFIINYKPVYSDTDQEQVVLTVGGYGATFNDYIIEAGELVDVNNNSQNGSTIFLNSGQFKAGDLYPALQSFTTGSGITKLSAVELVLAAWTPLDIGDIVSVAVYANQTDAEHTTTIAAPIATASMAISSQAAANYKFTFASPVSVNQSTQYWVQITNISIAPNAGFSYGVNLYYDSTSIYSGTFETLQYNGTAWFPAVGVTGDAYIKTYSSTGNTQSAFLSQDPSTILKTIIDNYNAQGGQITYTPSSIDLTGTTVSYTFNANTVFEGINKCLSMAPVGWYWYVDQANNILHFHKLSGNAQHTFTLGKNIKNLSVEKRSEDMVNIVYFIGGPVAGVNLFQKFTQQTSVDLYGRRAIRYTDNNVTLSSTATIIAQNILSTRGQVELRIEMDILDNGGQANSILGFDIESIVLGESVSFRSLGPGSGGTLWDVAKWDVNKWDFDVTDLSSVVVQVTRIDYTPDILHLTLSTVPPDITKRVEDIYRNLTQLSSLDNPASPS